MKERISKRCLELCNNDNRKDCFVITRFNLHLYKKDKENNPVLTDEWLRDRFNLFETYCLPSLKHQTKQSFYWIVLFASDTPANYKEKANEIHRDYSPFLPFFLDDEETKNYNEYTKKVIQVLKDDSNLLITIRIDNDDAIKGNFIERAYVFAKQQKVKEHLYTFKHGIQYYASANIADKVPYSYNHFVIMVDTSYNESDFRSVLQYNHGQIHMLGIPYRCVDSDEIMWAEVIHGRNMDNDFMMQPRHKPLLTRRLLIDNFGWNKMISPVMTIINIPFFLLPTAINHIVHRLKQKFHIIEKNH